jgi:glutaminyl-tRNA synthetase
VRLRYAYFIKCESVVKDENGEIVELRCTYDPETRGGHAPDGRKVKTTLHWVSADHALPAEVRLYGTLFTKEFPGNVEEGQDWRDNLNPQSLEVLEKCWMEPALADAPPTARLQLERIGYFCLDAKDSQPGNLVLNRTVTLRDPWANLQKRQNG